MKLVPNTALKVAIVESETKQVEIARRLRIPETRFSHIVRGRVTPTPQERERIAKYLKRPERDLFEGAA